MKLNMWLKEIIWIDKFKTKVETKHNVTIEEVEEALFNRTIFRRTNRGRVKGEDVYLGYGRTRSGRYLFIVFIYKLSMTGLVVSARDMTDKERKYYHAKKT